jgi:hypothetical protein
VGKFLIGGRLFYVALGGAINFFDIGVGYFVKTHMAVFTGQFAMNRGRKLLIINIKNPLGSFFVVPADAWIAMTQQAIARVGNGIGSKGNTQWQPAAQSRQGAHHKSF